MKRFVFIIAALLILISYTISGQKSESGSEKKIIVSGTITDQYDKPVEGAAIYIDSLPTGTVTYSSGKYKIKVNPGAKIIVAVSGKHGYGQAEIKENETINVKLNGDTKNLGIFLAMNTKEIPSGKKDKPEKANTYTNIYQMVRDKVPGVVVSGRSIVVQQPNSFFGSSQPLFVVDGVRVYNIDHLNPSEVKYIQLLKGSYAAIYGVEGANGVLCFTLKTGADK